VTGATQRAGHRGLGTLVGVLAAAAAISGCGAGGFGSDQPAEADRTIRSYVAIGDGFTAAPYTGTTVSDDGCLRSDVNYPALLAEELDISNVSDVSCTGATTSAITSESKPGKGKPPVQPQLDAIDEDTDLVTIGMGLEDRGLLRSVFRICTALPCTDKVAPQTILSDVDGMATSLRSAVRTIQDEAPAAYIVFIADEGSCRALPDLDQSGLDATRVVVDGINRKIRSVARETGVGYLDVARLSAGHELCSDEPWFEGRKGARGRAVAYHPVAAEQRAVAAELATLVKGR
jgi:hypothetical protein